MKKGKLIILSGPSGVGKGTLVKSILSTFPKTLKPQLSISMTTRLPRKGEINGKDYYFVTKEKFETLIKQNYFLEYAEFVGNYYGTPKEFIIEITNSGKSVILEIEVQGAKQVIGNYSDKNIISVFLLPPSLAELEKRIVGRNTNSQAEIIKRLNKAMVEIKESYLFQHKVTNFDIEQSTQDILNILQTEIN